MFGSNFKSYIQHSLHPATFQLDSSFSWNTILTQIVVLLNLSNQTLLLGVARLVLRLIRILHDLSLFLNFCFVLSSFPIFINKNKLFQILVTYYMLVHLKFLFSILNLWGTLLFLLYANKNFHVLNTSDMTVHIHTQTELSSLLLCHPFGFFMSAIHLFCH